MRLADDKRLKLTLVPQKKKLFLEVTQKTPKQGSSLFLGNFAAQKFFRQVWGNLDKSFLHPQNLLAPTPINPPDMTCMAEHTICSLKKATECT